MNQAIKTAKNQAHDGHKQRSLGKHKASEDAANPRNLSTSSGSPESEPFSQYFVAGDINKSRDCPSSQIERVSKMNSNSKRECLPVYGPSPVAPGNTTPWNLHYTTEDLGEVSVQGTRSQRQDLIRELAEKANNLGADIVLEAEFSTVNPQPESQYQIVDLLRKPEDSDPLYLSGRAFRMLPAAYIQAGGGFCGQKLS